MSCLPHGLVAPWIRASESDSVNVFEWPFRARTES